MPNTLSLWLSACARAGRAQGAEFAARPDLPARREALLRGIEAGDFRWLLRGLGIERTLVMVNGRRLGASGVRGAVGRSSRAVSI